MCGTNVRRYPAIARQVAEAGHEIGNHTDSHPYFFRCSSADILREIASRSSRFRMPPGITPRLFRAPTACAGSVCAPRSAIQPAGRDVDRDRARLGSPGPEAAARLIDRSSNGGILCLHDGRALDPHPDIRATLDAVERAVPVLRQHGFRFETVSEILCPTT
jgi:peptidoglycan/xylan/chitin deacetylase (PgdA/CDA1 family)